MSKITKLRILINTMGILLILILFSWLIRKDLVLDGKLTIESDLTQKQAMISVLYPEHRTKRQDDYFIINNEPIYFNVRSPIKFDKAEVEIEFKNNDQEIINLGIKTLEEGWDFKNYTLYNETLNEIEWEKISDGSNTLYQRKKNFNNLNNFLKVSNTIEGVSAYDFDLGESFLMPDYIPHYEEIKIEKCLRGEHKFYTYLKNEAMDFTFKIQDINRTDGEDPLIISVYNSYGKKIYSKIISDDGLIKKTDPASLPRYISIYIPDLEEGVYKIELSANDDIFIRQINTKQQKIVFIDRLYLCDNAEYSDGFIDLRLEPSRIYTNGRLISFYTAHTAGLQTINLDNRQIYISQKHQWFKIKSQPQLSQIYIPKNDIKISTRGIFALEENQYFNPEIIDLRDYSDISEVDYIIAKYQEPQKIKNDWLKNRVVFDLQNAKIENGNLKFMLSSPNLNIDGQKIDINKIKVKLIKINKTSTSEAYQNFWQNINTKFTKYFSLIKNKIF